jgi:hypothetical protein
MANLVTTEANNFLAASFGQAAYTAPVAPVKVRLCTTTGTASSAGTPVAGGSYADQTLAMSAPSGGSIANSGALNYTGMPAVTVASAEVWDSAGSPVRRWFGALTAAKTTNAGDTFTIAAGALTGAAG